MSDDPINDKDPDEIDVGPLKIKGHHAVIAIAVIAVAVLIAWAVVSAVSIRNGGEPVKIPAVSTGGAK